MGKIVIVSGSPRNGSNSELIADKIAEGAKENGFEIVKYKINSMNARPCQACMGCKKDGVCVIKDDVKTMLEDIKAADGVILSTPDYFGQYTAQFRIAQDRMYSFIDPQFKPFIEAGKKVAIVITCGGGYDGAVKIADELEGCMANFFKFEPIGKIVSSGLFAPGEAAEKKDIMDQAFEIGKKF